MPNASLPTHLTDLARGAKRLPHIALAIPLTPLLLVGGALVVLAPLTLGLSYLVGSERIARLLAGADPALASDPALYGVLAAAFLTLTFGPSFLALWLWLRVFEKRRFETLGFEPRRWLGRYVRGLGVGVALFTTVVGLLALTGMLWIEAPGALDSGPAAVFGAAVVFVGWMVQGAAEETVVRGWLMNVVGARYGLWLGVLVSVLVFAVLHGLNPGVGPLPLLNLALFGLFATLYALREGSLWGVCALHSVWNWMQGNVFGLAVSGNSGTGPTLWDLGAAGPDLWTGGSFGPEGGLYVTLVLLAACVMWIALIQRDSLRTPK